MFKSVCRVLCACALSSVIVLAAPPVAPVPPPAPAPPAAPAPAPAPPPTPAPPSPPAPGLKPANLSRFVVMGDSLSAGVENFSLLDTQQVNGYASLIAQQANTPLPLPLVPYPGAPNVLQLITLNPLNIQPAAGTLPSPPRDNPYQEAFNISVPGITVGDAITMRPTTDPNAPAVQQWATIVLGFPSLYLGLAPTQLETALALFPTTIIEALGNNDALVPALVGDLTQLTPLTQFQSNYKQVLDTLSLTQATIITATIPDVTEVPYFTPVKTIAAGACDLTPGCLDYIATELGVGTGDYVRLSAIPLVDSILSHMVAGPLPATCPSPLAALSPTPIPCILTAADAATLRSAINSYNNVIITQSATHNALVVDLHALVGQISANGYSIGTKTLTTSFLGGLFSLDGVHPTNTGYAVIANYFMTAMNQSLKTHLKQVNVPAIAAKDPLVF